MDIFHLLFTFVLLSVTGEVSGRVRLEPLNNVALQGHAARFNCSLEVDDWVMIWGLNSTTVLTISNEYGPMENSPRFTASNCSSGVTHCWEFVILHAQRNDSGPVTCDVQNVQKQMAQLSVQVNGSVAIVGGNVTVPQGRQVELQCVASGWFPEPTMSWAMNESAVDVSHYNTSGQPLGDLFNATSVLSVPADISTTVECLASVPALTTPLSSSIYLVVEPRVPAPTDWTVLIAVLASIGGFALLVLLILGIIFCRKHRKEAKSGYDEEMRRARTHSQLSTVSRSGQKLDQVNLGYAAEDEASVSPSHDSGYSQTNNSNNFEIPDDVNSNQAANNHPSEYHTTDGSGFKKHRHATIV